MKAIRCKAWCQPADLALEDVPRPEPRQGEVLIKVHTAALNFPDVLMIQGLYQVKPPLPFTPGFELAGTVEAVGPAVTDFAPGTRVLAQCDLGAFAEFALAPAHSVRPVPAGLNDDEAAAFPLVYQTSYFGLIYRGQLAPGESVLVHSAAGGVGLAAVQIARAFGAGKIIGTVGSDDKRDAVLAAGADVALNYQAENFVDAVKEATGGRGADVIYDPVGGDVSEQSTRCIAFEGRLVIIGFTSGKFPTFKGNHILVKNYSVVGLHWGFYRQMNPAKIEQGWRDLMNLFETGKLKPVIAARYPVAQVAQAMNHLTSRRAIGKIVLHW
ncbi:MAG TPA: NADPH:quinone oxidoreductase family protein [Pirellulales bacterium]|nr:NADPH:quinone oxidoreductase family protein [Pirellulales bacterium]